MHLLFRILFLSILLVSAAPAYARATETIRVEASTVTPVFPTSISFEVTAESSAAPLVAAQLLYGPARSNGLTLVELPVTPGQRVTLQHRLDTEVYYFPPGTEMSYRWVLRDADGNEMTTPLETFLYHDERFPWAERSERNVIVYWYEGGAAFGEEVITVATQTLDQLEQEIGAQLDQPVRIYVYASNSDMRSAIQRNSVEWVGGAAWTGLGVIIGGIMPGDTAEIERIIPHELSHQVLAQATRNPYGGVPVWFDEGLAVHNQIQRDLGWDELVEEAAIEGRLIPLSSLAASFPADPAQATLSYAQSRDMVEYMLDVHGPEAMRALVAAFATATPIDEALTKVIGMTVDEIDAAWRTTLPTQVREVPMVPGPQTAPPSRFDQAASVPQASQPDALSWLEQIQQQAPWALLVGFAFLVIVGLTIVGFVVVIVLRLAGVDKRTS